MNYAFNPTRRGRKKRHEENLRPDGLTQEQYDLLMGLAKEEDVSLATLKRRIVRDFLTQIGFSSDEQGLIDDKD